MEEVIFTQDDYPVHLARPLQSQEARNVQCDKVQNVQNALDDVHSQFPHLQPVQPGKVYDMSKILDSIQEAEGHGYSMRRNRERHDYKKLHLYGKGERDRKE